MTASSTPIVAVVLAILIAWHAYRGALALRAGAFRILSGPVDRESMPTVFWFGVAQQMLLCALLAGLFVSVVLRVGDATVAWWFVGYLVIYVALLFVTMVWAGTSRRRHDASAVNASVTWHCRALAMHVIRPLRIIAWQVTGKYPFQSNEEFSQAVMDLMARLERSGHPRAAAELRKGFGCLNGLTDGAALFLDSIAQVQATKAAQLTRDDQKALEMLRAVMHRAVYFPR